MNAVVIVGDQLATGCGDYLIRTFSIATRQLTRTLAGHTGGVYSLAVWGAMLVSGGGGFGDTTVRVWALEEAKGECVAELKGHSMPVYGVVVRDGVVVGQSEGKVIAWEPKAGP